MKEQTEYSYPAWCWVIFAVVMLFLFLSNPFGALALTGIFFWCKPYFTRWSEEIKGSPISPFMLVLFLGLLGYLIYYIYYRNKRKNK
jgi:hypothetical protein